MTSATTSGAELEAESIVTATGGGGLVGVGGGGEACELVRSGMDASSSAACGEISPNCCKLKFDTGSNIPSSASVLESSKDKRSIDAWVNVRLLCGVGGLGIVLIVLDVGGKDW